jgi:hypothetical protein
VWALTKGNVGRQYNENTTLTIVYERLMAEFERLEQSGHESEAGMIEKCAARTAELYQEIQNNDEDDEDGPAVMYATMRLN